MVFILRSFAEIETGPLKALLSLFRDYHGQIETPNLPAARIRILAAGDSKLWNLCCRKMWDTSPFNIAKRLFLDGLSRRELQEKNPRLGLEAAIRLRDLTDGVPALVELVGFGEDQRENLSHFFGPLQDPWNSLNPSVREALMGWAKGEPFPAHIPDYECPQIPDVASPASDAFWGGFLKIRHRQLVWRSPIHKSFVMQYSCPGEDRSKATLVRADLHSRVGQLEENLRENGLREEHVEEVISLGVQTACVQLVPVLEMVRKGDPLGTIKEAIETIFPGRVLQGDDTTDVEHTLGGEHPLTGIIKAALLDLECDSGPEVTRGRSSPEKSPRLIIRGVRRKGRLHHRFPRPPMSVLRWISPS